MIYFTKYATQKFDILKAHGLNWDKEMIEKVLQQPERTEEKGNNLTAEKDNIKVVYKQNKNDVTIITFYPIK